jgi:NDP-sugar pyrophosphorylase family protein
VSALQILMPMGGLGQRFRKVGVTTPKPLIDVAGMPMFMRALASFDPYPGDKRLIVVVREDNDREHRLGDRVREAHPDAEIVLLREDTRGAVETALAAEDLLDPDAPLVLMDCDIAFESAEYFEAIRQAAAAGTPEGILLSFRSSDPRYSFAEVDEHGLVVRTAEKRVISENALMGAYFFTAAGTFLEAGEQLMRRQVSAEMPEYFVSLVFNELVESGKRVGLASGDFYCFGTPEELDYFLRTGRPV